MSTTTQPDIIYYSKFCKYSENLLQFIVKNNLSDRFSFICVDKRTLHPKTKQLLVQLDNGSVVPVPPNITNVPSLCLVNNGYHVLVGNNIFAHLEPIVKNRGYSTTQNNGEPLSYSSGSSIGGILAGNSGLDKYSPVLGEAESLTIITPPEDYKSERLSDEHAVLAMKKIQEDMNQYMPKKPTMPSLPPTINMSSPINNFQGLSYS